MADWGLAKFVCSIVTPPREFTPDGERSLIIMCVLDRKDTRA